MKTKLMLCQLFFLDVAKGLVLGGIGFAAASPFTAKLIFIVFSVPLALWCVKTGLALLD